ncbi:MAG TPA: tetratricopeptide repeat protein [Anaeromyxobacter sp.]
MKALGWAVSCLLAAPASASADAALHAEYDSPLGRIRIAGDGTSYRGTLVAPSRRCGFAAGEEVLRATLLDDSLAGQVRVCLAGKACGQREEWSPAVLLATEGKLSGAVHVQAKGCRAPLGKRGGIAFTRAEGPPAGAAAAAPARSAAARREKARRLVKDGGAWLSEGNFEEARRRFLRAIEADPSIPEAYNGVGVAYRARNDLPRALEWYKKALAADADFGDAYYNMACVYALEGKKDMALRYLQIAALNGYATANGMDEDPDLETLRGDPGYRALVRAKM